MKKHRIKISSRLLLMLAWASFAWAAAPAALSAPADLPAHVVRIDPRSSFFQLHTDADVAAKALDLAELGIHRAIPYAWKD